MKSSIYMLSAVLLAAAACEALDQEPSTSVTTDTAIVSVEDLANAVNGAYYVATYGTTMTVASALFLTSQQPSGLALLNVYFIPAS